MLTASELFSHFVDSFRPKLGIEVPPLSQILWRVLVILFQFIFLISLTLLATLLCFRLVYHTYVAPEVSATSPVYLDYRQESPSAEVRMSSLLFRKGFTYHVDLDFEIPETPELVHGIGNVVVETQLTTRKGEDDVPCVLEKSVRPVRPLYKSPLLRYMETVTFAVPLVFGYTQQLQRIQIPAFRHFDVEESAPKCFGSEDLETSDADVQISIQISTPRFETYSCVLQVYTPLEGISYWLYNYHYTTLMVAVLTTLGVQMCLFFALQAIILAVKLIEARSSAHQPRKLPSSKHGAMRSYATKQQESGFSGRSASKSSSRFGSSMAQGTHIDLPVESDRDADDIAENRDLDGPEVEWGSPMDALFPSSSSSEEEETGERDEKRSIRRQSSSHHSGQSGLDAEEAKKDKEAKASSSRADTSGSGGVRERVDNGIDREEDAETVICAGDQGDEGHSVRRRTAYTVEHHT